jgi:hypothetical protein
MILARKARAWDVFAPAPPGQLVPLGVRQVEPH